MKKTWILMVVVLLICVCSICGQPVKAEVTTPVQKVGAKIYFGHYEQDNNTQNGDEPIEWQIMEIKDGKALLVSTYALDCQVYNRTDSGTSWENCSLRRWLNKDFLNAAFTPEEQKIILDTEVVNDSAHQTGKTGWGHYYGKNTIDKIFVLSSKEAKLYLKSAKILGTEYANANGARGNIFNDEASWYTRSWAQDKKHITRYHLDFEPINGLATQKGAIVPAMWVQWSAEWDSFPYARSQEAESEYRKANYEVAMSIVDELGTYNDSIAKASKYRYTYASNAYKKGDYNTGMERLISYTQFAVKHSVPFEEGYETTMPDCFNRVALQYFATGEHEKALETYDTLGKTYPDKAAEYRFLYDKKIMDSGDLETAVTMFREYYEYATKHSVEILPQYNDMIPECYYRMITQSMGANDYSRAIELLENLGQYKDSMSLLMTCYEKQHIQYSWLTKKDAAVNAGANTGYSQNNSIGVKDPHYGWSLGRFLMSGYTEVDDSGEYPIFIKTPGDSLVLWFDLTQDINQLNGNTDLVIAKDTDGYHQNFQTPKAETGYGALYLRHTDFRYSTAEPVSYFNYLAASESGVANTHVEVKEEGVYEVALDYEISDNNLMHAFGRVNNYRISFTFGIKNGSSMFYMFDIDTGAELEDYSRTAEGFRIDLANSHSLKIDVVRYALNQSGMGLDVRSSAPASDGDEFDRTGYYEITIQNTETGEKLVKHIFVGNRGDLADFQDADESMSQFSK